MNSVFLISIRVLASPLVNVFQKKLTNKEVSPEFIIMLSYAFFAIVTLPYILISRPFYFQSSFWYYIMLLGVFDIVGNMFLVKSLKTIDLSIFGPLNSFKPVIALILSVFMLDEMPTWLGGLGVLVIIAGSYFLGYQPGRSVRKKHLAFDRGLAYRFLAILFTAIAAVFSKKTILLSSPLTTLTYWSYIGLPISIIIYIMTKKRNAYEFKSLKHHYMPFAGLFVSFLLLQVFTLMTFEKVFVGYSLALFQLSGLVSVLFGYHFFKEKNISFRLVGASIMCVGAILIAIFG